MEEPENSELKQLADTVGDLVTGISAPIRKNFFKAFGQLCTAAVDIPVAKFQGRANEIRAESNARIQILKKQGEQIAEQLDIRKEYIDKASEKFASKIVKEQLNLDEIGINAANNLKQENFNENEQSETEEISDDWLNEFENYAKFKSSDDMKLAFGKILSGEIKKPGSFSIRTVRIISQLDNQVARLFQNLCSLSVTMYLGTHMFDARLVSLNGNAASNSLIKYGLSFDKLNVLHEYGLIISDYNSYMHYAPCILNEHMQVSARLCFGNKYYGLKPIDKDKFDKKAKFNGVSLTTAGKELLKIISIEEVANYKQDFEEFLNKKHFELMEVKNK